MEYNNEYNMNTETPVVLKEKKNEGLKIWYWIIALLVLGLLTWFAITSEWFGPKNQNIDNGGVQAGIENQAPGQDLATINAWQITTNESFPIEKTLVLSGNLANSCTYLGQVSQLREGNNFFITLPTRTEDAVCTQQLIPFEEAIELDILGLPAGVYTIDINGQQISFELEQDNMLEFNVEDSK